MALDKMVPEFVLQLAAARLKDARRNLVDGAAYLWQISTKKLWKDKYNSFADYLEEECQISESVASKLVQIYDHYVIKGGLDHERLREIDTEKLYLGMRTDGTAEEQVNRAAALTRGELRDEIHEDEDGHDCAHDSTIVICTKCRKRVDE